MSNKDIVARAVVTQDCPIKDYHQECTICSHFNGLKKTKSTLGTIFWVVQCKYK